MVPSCAFLPRKHKFKKDQNSTPLIIQNGQRNTTQKLNLWKEMNPEQSWDKLWSSETGGRTRRGSKTHTWLMKGRDPYMATPPWNTQSTVLAGRMNDKNVTCTRLSWTTQSVGLAASLIKSSLRAGLCDYDYIDWELTITKYPKKKKSGILDFTQGIFTRSSVLLPRILDYLSDMWKQERRDRSTKTQN